jgi:hypothetical protein
MNSKEDATPEHPSPGSCKRTFSSWERGALVPAEPVNADETVKLQIQPDILS